MKKYILFSSIGTDALEQIKSTGHHEIATFKADFNIIWLKLQNFINTFLDTLPNLIIAIIIFYFFYLSGNVVQKFIKRNTKIHKSVVLVFERISTIFLRLLGFFISLAIVFPSVKPVDVLGGLGIVSLAIGFAVKDLLNNFISGILILLQEPFRVGDEIKYNAIEGAVVYINIRYTVVLNYDGRRILIPNGEIYSAPITVNTATSYRMSYFKITVNSTRDLESFKEKILKIIMNIEGVLQNPQPKIIITNIEIQNIELQISWATRPNYDIMIEIKNKFLGQMSVLLSQIQHDID